MNKEMFVKELEKINIKVDKYQLEQLDKYYKLLVEWNNKINLTRIIQENDVYLKHFYDSLTLNNVLDMSQKMSICDIGTGAGFPGIVLKILFPSLSVTLVDALKKRVNFLNLVIEELNLKNIVAYHFRAEDFMKIHRGEFDMVTCRAVSKLTQLLDYCIPLVKSNGYFIPMKANCEDEIVDAKKKLKKMGCEIIEILEFDLPIENSHRTLIKIQKKQK